MQDAFTFGPFRFDPADGLRRGADEVPLPPRALAVLGALVANAGTVVSKQALLDAGWPDATVTEASLLEAIRLVRDALGDDRVAPTYIQTVHRRGYRFLAPATVVDRRTLLHRPTPAPTRAGEREATPETENLENLENFENLATPGNRENLEPNPRAPRTPRPQNQNPNPEHLANPENLEPEPRALRPPRTQNQNPENLANLENPENPFGPHLFFGLTAVAAMVGVAMVFALFGQRAPEPRPTMRFTIALPEDAAIDPLRGSLALSADGTRLVYRAIHDGRPRLFLRTVDREQPAPIEGSEDASDPFLSPDGEWVGFFAHGSLKKLRIEGGRAVALCAARAGGGATWLADGTIVFGGARGGGLARVSAEGGEPVILAAPRPGSRELAYTWPDILPDGSGLVYTVTTLGESAVALFDFASGERTKLVPAAAFGRVSPGGYLVFERRGRLEAAPFSSVARRITASPRPVVRGVATGSAPDGPRYAFSQTGSLVYLPGQTELAGDRLHWLESDGSLEPTPLPPAEIGPLDLTPDLKQLALTLEEDGGPSVWVGDVTRGALSRLVVGGASVHPTWRPDGLEVAFAFSKAGPFNIFVRPLDGDQPAQPLVESRWNQFPTSWSPDGRRLAYTEQHPLTGADIWLFDVVTRERQGLVRTLFDESQARFSPDGRWIAYMSNESGRWEVFVRSALPGGPRIQVSTTGGAWPCWSTDGRTIYFTAGGRAAAARIQTTPALAAAAPEIIATRADVRPAGGFAAPGRVLVREDASAPDRRELRVIVEWFAELGRLLRSAS